MPSTKYFIIQLGKTGIYPVLGDFEKQLKQILGLKEVKKVEECGFVLVFCPVASRVGTDINTALESINYIPDFKPIILVMLHQVIDAESIVPNSARIVNKENIFTVDCLVHEDQGLLMCSKNEDSIKNIAEHIKEKTHASQKSGQKPFEFVTNQVKHLTRTRQDKNFYLFITGNTLKSHETFINSLKKLTKGLKNVSKIEECDFVMVFCPVASQQEAAINSAIQKINAISATKPAVLVVLHHTLDPELNVPDSSRYVNRENTFTVDGLFHEDQGLLKCLKNDDSLARLKEHITFKKSATTGLQTQRMEHTENKTDQKQHEPLSETMLDLKQIHICTLGGEMEKFKDEHQSLKTTDITMLKLLTEMTLVLLGRTGSGKTSVRNTILSAQESDESPSTKNCNCTQTVVKGRKLNIVDTSGWFNNIYSLEKIAEGLCVHLSAPGPRAFLFVIPVKDLEEQEVLTSEQNIISKMERILGKECWKNTMILFTVTNEAQIDKIMDLKLHNDEVQILLEKCEERDHNINIKNTVNRSQVLGLLEKIENMVQGKRNEEESLKLLTGMERYREKKAEMLHEMWKIQKQCERFIQGFETDISALINQTESQQPEITQLVEKLKSVNEIKSQFVEEIKTTYERIAGMEDNRRFIKVIMPESMKTLWLAVPNELPEEMTADRELDSFKEWLSLITKKPMDIQNK